jgi:hypothetical protein
MGVAENDRGQNNKVTSTLNYILYILTHILKFKIYNINDTRNKRTYPNFP